MNNISSILLLMNTWRAFSERGLTCEDKQLVLEMHNQLRQSVALGQVQGQPAASSMMLLVSDNHSIHINLAQNWKDAQVLIILVRP